VSVCREASSIFWKLNPPLFPEGTAEFDVYAAKAGEGMEEICAVGEKSIYE
jgi:hypothetical protein